MPTLGDGNYRNASARIRLAEQQVSKKFPTLIRGSSGWHRAVSYRFSRNIRRSY